MNSPIEPIVRAGGSLALLLLPFLYPGYWLARYVRTPRLNHLRHAIVGLFAYHFVLLLQSPVVAYPGTRYVWESIPGQSGFADAMYVQLLLLSLLAGIVMYGLWRANSTILAIATATLVLFMFGIPVSFWYWLVLALEAALILLYISRIVGGFPTYGASAGT
jgi:hypothetical protein